MAGRKVAVAKAGSEKAKRKAGPSGQLELVAAAPSKGVQARPRPRGAPAGIPPAAPVRPRKAAAPAPAPPPPEPPEAAPAEAPKGPKRRATAEQLAA